MNSLLIAVARCSLALGILLSIPVAGQSKEHSQSTEAVHTLEHKFFDAIRNGDVETVLSYIPDSGVNIGSKAEHTSRNEAERQLRFHHGLYCKLFDSSCIDAPIQLDNAQRPCSYRELLTHSEKVTTAASEVTRGGVQQGVLVARIENKHCPTDKLVDFIFNLNADGWKLFSVP